MCAHAECEKIWSNVSQLRVLGQYVVLGPKKTNLRKLVRISEMVQIQKMAPVPTPLDKEEIGLSRKTKDTHYY